MLATVLSAAVQGLDGTPVSVEVDLQRGLRTFHIVGLPSPAVRESRERVLAALQNSGFELPEMRLTVNLAPADLPKEGSGFDLPIALGTLIASGQCPAAALAGWCVLGELALDGVLRPVRGVLPIAIAMRALGRQRLLVPEGNAAEARLVPDVEVASCRSLEEAASRLGARATKRRGRSARGVATAQRLEIETTTPVDPSSHSEVPLTGPDLSHVFGHALAKRALAVAAAGGHHVLMVGPPGTGKTMLARCLPALLPPLAESEALEVRQVLSVCGRAVEAAAPIVARPFRAPHHTLSVPGLVGGGRPVAPGEITLAHRGVLFLDELPEFPRHLLDLLRQPLEDGEIHLTRANQRLRYPARFQLVAAMNPCPCGFLGHPKKPCRCTPVDLDRYRSRISGPILDRIDLRIEMQNPPLEKIGQMGDTAEGEVMRARIVTARARQATRYANLAGVHCNAQAPARERRTFVRPHCEAETLLRRAMARWHLSVRGYERTLAVARSIADLDEADEVDAQHVAEALQYRTQAGESGR